MQRNRSPEREEAAEKRYANIRGPLRLREGRKGNNMKLGLIRTIFNTGAPNTRDEHMGTEEDF